MLVLSRTVGERILIDGGIVVTVLQAANGKARIGIDAPAGCRIIREELTERDTAATMPTDPASEPRSWLTGGDFSSAKTAE